MKIIMHYPIAAEKQEELAQKVAQFHAKAVIAYINALPCTYEEKISLIERIKNITRKDGKKKQQKNKD